VRRFQGAAGTVDAGEVHELPCAFLAGVVVVLLLLVAVVEATGGEVRRPLVQIGHHLHLQGRHIETRTWEMDRARVANGQRIVVLRVSSHL